MAKTTPVFNNFSSGVLTPLLLARTDFERFRTGAQDLTNWNILLQGGLRSRYGWRYAWTTKFATGVTVLRTFLPTATAAYTIEMGHLYFRFGTNSTRLESPPGTPVEVVTPYVGADVRRIRTAQANDVMILAHEAYPPARLSRLSATSFRYREITFRPPPTFEAGFQPAATLSLSALTGDITLTTSPGIWLQSDVNRIVSSEDARAVITAYTSSTVVNATVIDDFVSSPMAAGAWTLEGSPVANLQPDLTGPVGARVTLELQGLTPSGADLVGDGHFTSGQGGWTDQSAPTFLTGTHNGSSNVLFLNDSTKNFLTLGVVAGMRVENTTDGSSGTASTLTTTTNPNDTINLSPVLSGGTENDFDSTDAYAIHKTGTALFTAGVATLSGGAGGANALAAIQRAITTVVGRTYTVQFDVIGASVSLQVGSTSGAADRLAEATYVVGNARTATFEATTTTSYVQFRNNQNTNAVIDNVTVKQLSIDGWRTTDVGRYVRLHGGITHILSYINATEVQAEVLRVLSTTDAAAAGTWTLEDSRWSATLGYPSVVVLYEGRLYFAFSPQFPQTVWGSAVDSFFDFFVGPNPADAVELSLVDSGGNITLNQGRALMPAENLLALTTGPEYRLIGSGDDPITPVTPPRVRVQSTYGAAAVQPMKVGPAVLFVELGGRGLLEMAFQDTTNSFLAKDLLDLAEHLTRDRTIIELAYQPKPVPTIWALGSDGILLPLTYHLLQKVEAWAVHTTDGLTQSIASLYDPVLEQHQLWGVNQRTVGGTAVQYVEYMDALSEMRYPTAVNGVIPSWKGLTVDSAVVYTFSTPTATLTGLGHLEGRTVAIVADGAVFPSQVVQGGQVLLSLPVLRAWGGLPYTCTGETLPVEFLLPTGSSQVKQKAWISLLARVQETIGLTIEGEQLPFRTPGMPVSEGVTPFSGDIPDLLPPGGWDRGATITFAQMQPLPATLLGLFGELDIGAE